jgi:hypothetical protein
MKRNHKRIRGSILVAGIVLFMFSATRCNMDFTNPNAATEDQVMTTSAGIIADAVGLQQYYAETAMWYIVLAPGITAHEVACERTFSWRIMLEQGGTALTTDNGEVLEVWSRLNHVVGMAANLAKNASNAGLVAGTRSGVLALADLFKAMALGYLIQSFEQAPIDADLNGNAQFKSRAEVLSEAIRLLDDALQQITTTPPSSEFTSSVLGSGFDLTNTIHTYRARYSLLAGRYQEAIDASNLVNLTAKSVFNYTSRSQNPIYTEVIVNTYYAPLDSLGLRAPLIEANDGRLAFYVIPASKLSVPGNHPVDDTKGFFNLITGPIPAYLPGEIHLIKAEAYVQLGNLTAAVQEINTIRTKTPSQDPFGIGASLPAYSGATTTAALLTEIYRQRCAELYMTGMRWEDSRRLGRPGPNDANPERNRNFYPYPMQERTNNPNTPPDPAI